MTGTWAGPGTFVVPDGGDGYLYTGGLNTSGTEFNGNQSRDGLAVVWDTPNGTLLATRDSVSSPFSSIVPVDYDLSSTGFDACLTLYDLDDDGALEDCIVFADGKDLILVAEVDLDPTSPTYGDATVQPNTLVEFFFDPWSAPPDLYVHSPTPIEDELGVMYAFGYHETDGDPLGTLETEVIVGHAASALAGFDTRFPVCEVDHYLGNPGQYGGTLFEPQADWWSYYDTLRLDLVMVFGEE